MNNAIYKKLNGVKNGIVVYLYNEGDFVKDNKGNRKLFKNLDLMEAYLASKLGIFDPYQYKLWIMLGEDNVEIDFDNVEKLHNYFEYYCGDKVYFIEEDKVDLITSIGYFVFDEEKKGDNKNGQKKADMFYSAINLSLKHLFGYYNSIPTIDNIGKDSNNHLCAHVKGTTYKIHICKNSQLMDLNVQRKMQEIRCIPYIKEMDKYRSIFCYITKDESDKDEETRKSTEDIIQFIIADLSKNSSIDYIRYVPVEYKGYVKIKGGN